MKGMEEIVTETQATGLWSQSRWDDREQSPWPQAAPRWSNLLLRLSLRKSEVLRLLSHGVVQVTKKLAERARPHDDAAARWTPLCVLG